MTLEKERSSSSAGIHPSRAADCVPVHSTPLFAPSTHFLPCSRPISSPSKHSPMNIPELTSASSIRSGQGEIREQTGWEAKEEGGMMVCGGRENEPRRRRAARTRNSDSLRHVFRTKRSRGSFHLQIDSEGDLDETLYYMLNVRPVSLTGCSLVWLNNDSPGWNCSWWHRSVVFVSHYSCTCEEHSRCW